MYVMHCLTMKLLPVLRWALPSRGHGPVVALAIVESMIDVSVEMIRPVIPRSSPYEYAAREPLRAIVTVRGAAIRGALLVSVGTNRPRSNSDAHLCSRLVDRNHEKARSNSRKS